MTRPAVVNPDIVVTENFDDDDDDDNASETTTMDEDDSMGTERSPINNRRDYYYAIKSQTLTLPLPLGSLALNRRHSADLFTSRLLLSNQW